MDSSDLLKLRNALHILSPRVDIGIILSSSETALQLQSLLKCQYHKDANVWTGRMTYSGGSPLQIVATVMPDASDDETTTEFTTSFINQWNPTFLSVMHTDPFQYYAVKAATYKQQQRHISEPHYLKEFMPYSRPKIIDNSLIFEIFDAVEKHNSDISNYSLHLLPTFSNLDMTLDYIKLHWYEQSLFID